MRVFHMEPAAANSRILREFFPGEMTSVKESMGASGMAGKKFGLERVTRCWHVFSLIKISLSKHLTTVSICCNQHGLFTMS